CAGCCQESRRDQSSWERTITGAIAAQRANAISERRREVRFRFRMGVLPFSIDVWLRIGVVRRKPRANGTGDTMRKIIYGINITLDGCCDHMKMIPDDEVHQHFARLLDGAGLLVYGRKTYELMVPFWPDVAKNQSMDEAGNEFARVFDALPKVVFSRAS